MKPEEIEARHLERTAVNGLVDAVDELERHRRQLAHAMGMAPQESYATLINHAKAEHQELLRLRTVMDAIKRAVPLVLLLCLALLAPACDVWVGGEPAAAADLGVPVDLGAVCPRPSGCPCREGTRCVLGSFGWICLTCPPPDLRIPSEGAR